MPTLKLDADARAGVKAFADLDKAVAKVDGTLELTARQAKALELQAKRIADSNLSPQEKYNKKLEEMARMVKAGKLELVDAHTQATKLAQRYNEVDKAGEKAFGAGMTSRIGGMVSGMVGFGTIVSGIVAGFRSIDQVAKEASASVGSSLASIGDLQLISENKQDFLKNIGVAREIVKRGIVDEQASYGIAGDISVAGLSDDERNQFLDRLQRRQIKPEDASGALISGQKVANLYPQGSLKYGQVLDKLAVASGPGASSPGEFAKGSTQWAQLASMLGMAGDEGLAAQMVAEKHAGNVDIAATQINELLAQIQKKDLWQGSLEATVPFIKEQMKANPKLLEGNALKAMESLVKDLPLVGQYRTQLASATGTIDSKYFLQADEAADASQLKSQTEGQLADAKRQYARQQDVFESVRNSRLAYQQQRGQRWRAYGSEWTSWIDDKLGTERLYIDDALRNNSQMIAPDVRQKAGSFLLDTAGSESEKQEVLQLLRSINVHVGGTERAVSNGGGSTVQESPTGGGMR
ncbi:hypothetical protein [Aeoliella sp. SH292]|uniref:hypothetical protein n=1 Tax=Aeoliella sp. SH292 TaxID=3454464 RepID=UPI003F94E4DB